MTPEELRATNALYDEHLSGWIQHAACYEGPDAMVEAGLVQQHERESNEAWDRRKKELFGFGYSAMVVDLFIHYLFRKPPEREYGETLAGDALFQQFLDDADREDNDLDSVLREAARQVSVLGSYGILVDAPSYQAATLAEQLEYGLYPYTALFQPQNILDWRYERNEYGRKELVYLKLMEEDGTYYLWWPNRWERWRIKEDTVEKKVIEVAYIEAEGEHSLGSIPFVWLQGDKRPGQVVGKSDLTIIGSIDASVVRNLSQAEEVIAFAGFPMLRRAMPRMGDDGTVTVGPTSVLEFDPELGEAGKPDMLPAQIAEAMTGIDNFLERKERAIFHAAHIGGTGVIGDSQVASGVALAIKFQQLNAKLAAKAEAMAEVERKIIWYWLKWRGMDRLWEQVSIEWPQTFDVEDMAADLEHSLASLTLFAGAPTLQREVKKTMARRILAGTPPEILEQGFEELDRPAPDIMAAPAQFMREEEEVDAS